MWATVRAGKPPSLLSVCAHFWQRHRVPLSRGCWSYWALIRLNYSRCVMIRLCWSREKVSVSEGDNQWPCRWQVTCPQRKWVSHASHKHGQQGGALAQSVSSEPGRISAVTMEQRGGTPQNSHMRWAFVVLRRGGPAWFTCSSLVCTCFRASSN